MSAGGQRPAVVADPASSIHFLEVGPHTLRFVVRRGVDAARPPLLLINGIGASLETFDPLLAVLDPELEVIRFDGPGIGGSPRSRSPYRLPGLARHVGRALAQLGYDRVDVLGISWGGALAQQFALTERRRCRRLVLVATGTGAIMVPGRPRVLAKMVTPRRYRDAGYLRSVAGEMYGGRARSDTEGLDALLGHWGRGGQQTGYALQLLAVSGWTSVPFLPLLTQPTLVLTGDDDPIIHVVNGKIIAALIRSARLHVYAGGHIDLVAAPDLLAPTIEDFLTRP